LIHGDWGLAGRGREEPPDHALDRGEVEAGVGVGPDVVEFLDVVNLSEGPEIFEAEFLETVAGLVAESLAVHEEERAAEAAVFDEAEEQGDGDAGLAGARGHSHQSGAVASGNGFLDLFHRLDLVAVQGGYVNRGIQQGRGGGDVVGLKQVHQAVGGVPAIQRAGMIGAEAKVLEPDSALFLQLAQERTTISGEHEGDLVFVPGPARARLVALRGEAATVTACLGEAPGNIFDVAFGLGDAQRREANEKNIIRGPARSGPLSDGAVQAALCARAAGEGQFLGTYLPTRLPELAIDAFAGGGLVLV